MNEANKKSIGEKGAIVISILFLLLGVFVVWLAKNIADIEGDAIYITLILIPILVYVIISGRLRELKGPGGLEARFSEAASQDIKPSYETVEPSVEEMQILAKGGLRELQHKKFDIDESRPIVMTMILGKGGYYDWQAVTQYMNFLSQYSNFKFVVFLDGKNQFVAYMPSWAFIGLIKLPELADEFIEIINDGCIKDLYRYPGVVKDTISTKSTNIVALQQMMIENLEALVVIDEERHLKGVLEREQVISKIILTLVRE